MENQDSQKLESPKESKYWLSLEQWRNDKEFQELASKEFMTSPFAPEEAQGGWARREFLKLMGASLALSSFGCVRRPAQKIVPYAKRPTEVVPGLANYYASSFVDQGEVLGTVVTTREGRPIKVEGNPEHPSNQGGMSARAHAEVLSLYDPDRANGPKKNLLNEKKTNRDTIGQDWKALDKSVVEALNSGRVALLTSSVVSPSTRQLVKDFSSAFSVKHFVWDDLDSSTLLESQRLSYGSAQSPQYKLDKADFIVSVGADFLGTYFAPTGMTRQFSSRRHPDGSMNRLVVFESMLSLTGSNADERHIVKSSEYLDVVVALLKTLVVDQGRSSFASSTGVKNWLKSFAANSSLDSKVIQSVADELWKNKGRSLVLTGDLTSQTKEALALHMAVNLLNSVLGNEGVTVGAGKSSAFEGRTQNLVDLVSAINEGKVDTLLVWGANPIYSAPAGVDFKSALQKVKTSVYMGDRNDETGLYCDYLAPDHHPMESWSDAEDFAGHRSIQQPTVRPLYDTRAFQDSLMSWARLAKKGSARLRGEDWYSYLRAQWGSKYSSDAAWNKLLQEGVTTTDSSLRARSFRSSNLSVLKKSTKDSSDYELVLYSTVGLRNGRLANVSWLQEFPDPVTRICWDNYLCVSTDFAHKHHLKEGQQIDVTVGERTLRVPAHIQPGLEKQTVALAVGYGREAAGEVANGVGVNAFGFARFEDGTLQTAALPVKLKKAGVCISLANVQGHHSMEGRQIVVEATLDQFKENPAANIHKHKMRNMWPNSFYDKGHKWGMSIDLNKCTGCGSCVVACQSENNIPTVGKRYVLQGRAMHWIRIDRYYVGTPENPDEVFMPVTCMHCDNAPCETVCPVAATVHSDEGTNDMIYNRCVETRYCANNCPYKVRRFNWFKYDDVRSPLHMAMNPEVTVRSRGVMEKCTFCTHRIKAVKSQKANEKAELKDGDILTACQQSCPAQAITFGDMNNPESAVSKAFKEERTYDLLQELNVGPAVRYKTKIRHTAQLKGKDSGGHH